MSEFPKDADTEENPNRGKPVVKRTPKEPKPAKEPKAKAASKGKSTTSKTTKAKPKKRAEESEEEEEDDAEEGRDTTRRRTTRKRRAARIEVRRLSSLLTVSLQPPLHPAVLVAATPPRPFEYYSRSNDHVTTPAAPTLGCCSARSLFDVSALVLRIAARCRLDVSPRCVYVRAHVAVPRCSPGPMTPSRTPLYALLTHTSVLVVGRAVVGPSSYVRPHPYLLLSPPVLVHDLCAHCAADWEAPDVDATSSGAPLLDSFRSILFCSVHPSSFRWVGFASSTASFSSSPSSTFGGRVRGPSLWSAVCIRSASISVACFRFLSFATTVELVIGICIPPVRARPSACSLRPASCVVRASGALRFASYLLFPPPSAPSAVRLHSHSWPSAPIPPTHTRRRPAAAAGRGLCPPFAQASPFLQCASICFLPPSLRASATPFSLPVLCLGFWCLGFFLSPFSCVFASLQPSSFLSLFPFLGEARVSGPQIGPTSLLFPPCSAGWGAGIDHFPCARTVTVTVVFKYLLFLSSYFSSSYETQRQWT
ncbi:hypothetical protein K438DRAFT_1962956 [Mycena galopus ATCC 62051]|nr:hypothetical protein K438DRAFT_1962956 [Mycena galopus ATCC 62051]